MSRHHPYAGYDDSHGSGFSGGSHRKSGRHSGSWSGRRGGPTGHRGNWDSEAGSDKGFSDFGEFGHENFMGSRGGSGGGSKSGKFKGARVKGKGPTPSANVGERELTIDERIQRERPCRTLFVRNVKYETNPQEVREKFEAMGEIKTFFDLIPNRGMIFVTYYDIRAATMAKEQLQGADVSGRPIDVHYSLPKDNELEKRCDRDKNQATLFLAISGANRVIDDDELRAKFNMFGEVRSIKQFKESPYQRFVEFWDTRASESAYDNLVGTSYLGGKLDLKFSWDTGMVPKTRLPREMRGGYQGDMSGRDNYNHHHNQHGRSGFHGYGGGHMHDGYREGRNSFDASQGHGGYPATSSYAQEYNDSMRMRGPSGSNAISAASQSNATSFDQSHREAYQNPLSNSLNSNNRMSSGGLPILSGIAGESSESRLDQAQKVQDLLASLANGANSGSGSTLAAPSMTQSNPGHTSNMTMPPTIQSAYGLALPATANSNSYTAAYPTYPSIPANNYQPHINPLSGASESHNLANASYAALTNPANRVTSLGAQLGSQLSALTPAVPSSLYQPMADQAQLARSTSVAADPLTPASAISPAILSLLSQASATNPSTTRSSDPSGLDAYPLPSAGPYDQSSSAPAASGPAIPTGPRAMQANAVSSNGVTTRAGNVAASTSNSDGQSTAATAASSQAAVQQLLILLQQQQQQLRQH